MKTCPVMLFDLAKDRVSGESCPSPKGEDVRAPGTPRHHAEREHSPRPKLGPDNAARQRYTRCPSLRLWLFVFLFVCPLPLPRASPRPLPVHPPRPILTQVTVANNLGGFIGPQRLPGWPLPRWGWNVAQPFFCATKACRPSSMRPHSQTFYLF